MTKPQPPTDNPDEAGTAPIDLTRISTNPPQAPDSAGAETPDRTVGGAATIAATSWSGASEDELKQS